MTDETHGLTDLRTHTRIVSFIVLDFTQHTIILLNVRIFYTTQKYFIAYIKLRADARQSVVVGV